MRVPEKLPITSKRMYDCTVTKEEIMYLAIHIRRITTDSDE